MESLRDKEYSLISAIARNSAQTQRELSQNAGLSLGMTNLLLKKLVRKGYVKVKQLDWKRTQYLLTMEGLLEKTRKSYAYALHAIGQFRLLRERIRELVLKEYASGLRRAYVVAWPETAEIIRAAVEELALPDLKIEYLESFRKHLGDKPGTAFTATIEPQPEPKPGQNFIPLLELDNLQFKFPPGNGGGRHVL